MASNRLIAREQKPPLASEHALNHADAAPCQENGAK